MQLLDSEEVVLNIEPKDDAGNPAAVEPGSVVVTPVDPAVLEVVAGDDETHPIIRSTGAVGSSAVNVSADADLGPGIATLSATTETIDVGGGQATSLGIGFGAPRPRTG